MLGFPIPDIQIRTIKNQKNPSLYLQVFFLVLPKVLDDPKGPPGHQGGGTKHVNLRSVCEKTPRSRNLKAMRNGRGPAADGEAHKIIQKP